MLIALFNASTPRVAIPTETASSRSQEIRTVDSFFRRSSFPVDWAGAIDGTLDQFVNLPSFLVRSMDCSRRRFELALLC